MSPQKMILIGLLLVLAGVALPGLMLLRFVETTFLLAFLSYGASVTGLILGMIGSAMYARMLQD
jgi:hypothetical protein